MVAAVLHWAAVDPVVAHLSQVAGEPMVAAVLHWAAADPAVAHLSQVAGEPMVAAVLHWAAVDPAVAHLSRVAGEPMVAAVLHWAAADPAVAHLSRVAADLADAASRQGTADLSARLPQLQHRSPSALMVLLAPGLVERCCCPKRRRPAGRRSRPQLLRLPRLLPNATREFRSTWFSHSAGDSPAVPFRANPKCARPASAFPKKHQEVAWPSLETRLPACTTNPKNLGPVLAKEGKQLSPRQ